MDGWMDGTEKRKVRIYCCCCWKDETYPFVDVHLECVVVEREDICVWAVGCVAMHMLQAQIQTYVKPQLATLCVKSTYQK